MDVITGAVAVVLAMVLPLAGVPVDLPSHPDLIVGGLGLDGANTIVPEGFIQVDGGLFDTSEQAETGLYRGVAYEPVNHSDTGLIVGGGY